MTSKAENNPSPENDSRYTFSAIRRKDQETGLTFLRLECVDRADPTKSLLAEIAPEIGSNIVTFQSGNHDIFYRDTALLKDKKRKDKWTGCFVIGTPANRIDLDGRKSINLNGHEISLEKRKREQGNDPLVHGLVDDLPWKVDKMGADGNSARVSTYIDMDPSNPHWEFLPIEHKMGLDFVLGKDGLTVNFNIHNMSRENLPFNAALHPYYPSEGAEIRIAADGHMPTSPELLPTGEIEDVTNTEFDLRQPTSIIDTDFDDVWTSLNSGNDTFIQWPNKSLRVRQIVDPNIWSHAVLFTQHQNQGYVCLEPQAGSTNAINLNAKAEKERDQDLKEAANLKEIPPGETLNTSVTFAVEHLESSAA